ncbi:MAG: LysR family transcriptional regulator [Gammaproteobacteria bacterium]|nr:LysR family transcriptional regulator [Gammaproteobacteria bacterium]
MSIKISTLQTFVTVAECGRLAEAAKRLHRTPSAVSMALKSLETHLGRPLFEADRKSRLTPLGRYVLELAREELERFDHAVRAMERYARNETGSLTIACVPTASTRVLPRVIKRFLERWPGIEIDVRDMDSLSVRRELERGRVELGIATPIGLQPGFDSNLLTRDAFGVICSRRHPLNKIDSPLEWRHIEPYPFIANPICRLIEDPVFQNILAASILTVRNTTSIVSLVASDVGVTVLPRLAIDGGANQVRFLPLAKKGLFRELHIMRRANTTPTPVAQAFMEALLTSVDENS